MATIKKYNGSTWENTTARKYETKSEIITPPTTIYADGSNITTYTIKGNTVQNGTPSPQNPVMPNGVGVRTENLWNESYTGITQDVITYRPLNVGDGDYTLSSTVAREGQAAALFLLAGNVSTGATTVNNGVWNGQNRTVTAVDGYVTIGYRKYSYIANPENANTMLNTGSTPKPYEPYGYKIPILSNQQTTNIYLGSTQTVRKIGQLIFDGTENWGLLSINSHGIANFRLTISADDASMRGSNTAYCTHYVQQQSLIADTTTEGFLIADNNPTSSFYIRTYATDYDTKDKFKAYLSAQYSNNTPVTIYYQYYQAHTGAYNRPLYKIASNADTLSNATVIPTTEGANSISVDTTVQPSEFTATWTGWHDSSVKEWDGSDWS